MTVTGKEGAALKASDISDALICQTIYNCGGTSEFNWAWTMDIFPALSNFPEKVVLAKLRKAIKKGLAKGCTCGCRGDFYLTDQGKLLL